MAERSVGHPELPEGMRSHAVMIDGEPYVSLRAVYAAFEHTEEGMAFYRIRRRWLRKDSVNGVRMLWTETETRPQTFLEKFLGKLP